MKRLILAVIAFAMVASACSIIDQGVGATATTPVSQSTTTTSTTPTTEPVPETTTTTTTTPMLIVEQIKTDVLVYGSSLAAVGVAVTAARQGRSVIMVVRTDYLGGQASNGYVSTMDEFPTFFNRESGLYGELYNQMVEEYGDTKLNTCYWDKKSFCPEPIKVKQAFDGWLKDAGVEMYISYSPIDVLQSGATVTGLLFQTPWRPDLRLEISADVVVDGSEVGELYPLIEGLEYSVGNGVCVQKTTWNVVMAEYVLGEIPDHFRPQPDAETVMRDYYGDETVDGWIAAINREIKVDGYDVFPGWNEYNANRAKGLTAEVFRGYRGLADERDIPGEPRITKSVNNYGFLDSPISAEAMAEPFGEKFVYEFTMAKDRAYFFLYYAYYVLGIENWGVDPSQRPDYDAPDQMLWSRRIPDWLESAFAGQPYFREHPRIEGVSRMTWDMIYGRELGKGQNLFDDSVMVGGYMTDQHGCAGPEEPLGDGEKLSDYFSFYGAYDVDPNIFIPVKIDGFLPGIVAGASVDRMVAGSLRLQPTELIGGQVVGTLAAIASELGIQPREVDMLVLRQRLIDQGVIVDAPASYDY